jgi:hypothetical protein
MAYIGRPQQVGPYIKLDDISDQFNGTASTFNLTLGGKPYFTPNPYTLLLSLDGVFQEPITSYVISGSQITFAAPPVSTAKFYCIVLGTTFNTTALKSLTIGSRTTAYTIPINGDAFGVFPRSGNKIYVAFNAA